LQADDIVDVSSNDTVTFRLSEHYMYNDRILVSFLYT